MNSVIERLVALYQRKLHSVHEVALTLLELSIHISSTRNVRHSTIWYVHYRIINSHFLMGFLVIYTHTPPPSSNKRVPSKLRQMKLHHRVQESPYPMEGILKWSNSRWPQVFLPIKWFRKLVITRVNWVDAELVFKIKI